MDVETGEQVLSYDNCKSNCDRSRYFLPKKVHLLECQTTIFFKFVKYPS